LPWPWPGSGLGAAPDGPACRPVSVTGSVSNTMLSWLMWLVLIGLLFRGGDMLINALWPLREDAWKEEARKWRWSPEGLAAQAAVARWYEAKKASLLVERARRTPAPQGDSPPAARRP
jgi:hypothetical protein